MFYPSGLSTVRMLALASIIPFGNAGAADAPDNPAEILELPTEIGRASCRERVCLAV